MAGSFKKKYWSDYYTQAAKKNNYPARSVYKLQEIQKKYGILKKRDSVLDLGCAPGSWLLYASKMVSPEGNVVGIDLNPVKLKFPDNVLILRENIQHFEKLRYEQIKKKFNVILSDISPQTTGNWLVDATKSLILCDKVLEIVSTSLTCEGNFVCKVFQGEDLETFHMSVKNKFRKCFLFKPKSSRKKSREIYIIGLSKTRNQSI